MTETQTELEHLQRTGPPDGRWLDFPPPFRSAGCVSLTVRLLLDPQRDPAGHSWSVGLAGKAPTAGLAGQIPSHHIPSTTCCSTCGGTWSPGPCSTIHAEILSTACVCLAFRFLLLFRHDERRVGQHRLPTLPARLLPRLFGLHLLHALRCRAHDQDPGRRRPGVLRVPGRKWRWLVGEGKEQSFPPKLQTSTSDLKSQTRRRFVCRFCLRFSCSRAIGVQKHCLWSMESMA